MKQYQHQHARNHCQKHWLIKMTIHKVLELTFETILYILFLAIALNVIPI
jgi:hypothetical protein